MSLRDELLRVVAREVRASLHGPGPEVAREVLADYVRGALERGAYMELAEFLGFSQNLIDAALAALASGGPTANVTAAETPDAEPQEPAVSASPSGAVPPVTGPNRPGGADVIVGAVLQEDRLPAAPWRQSPEPTPPSELEDGDIEDETGAAPEGDGA